MSLTPLGAVVLLLHCDDVSTSTTLADATPYAQNAKCYGTCAPSTGQSMFGGSSVKTGNANGNFFAVGTNQTMDFGAADFTVEGFLYPVSQGSDGGAILGRWNGTSNDFLLTRNTDGSMGVYLNGDLVLTTGAGDLPLNTWTHVAVVRSTGTVNAYIGGTSKGSASFVAAINCTHGVPLYFGQANQSGGATWLEAYYDEIRLSNGTAQYAGNFTPPTSPFGAVQVPDTQVSLLMHCDATPFTDSSTFSHTISATATVSSSNAKFGSGSAAFDGASTKIDVTVGDDCTFGTGDFTVECWVYPTAAPSNYATLVDFRPTGTNGAYPAFFIQSDLSILSFLNNANAVVSSNKVTLNTWNHVALARVSGVTSIYVNGGFGGSYTDNNTYSAVSRVRLGLSGWASANDLPLQGNLDEIRISKGIARYTGAFSPPSAPFTGLTDGGASDPSFSSVSVLLHLDGANGSTTFTDSSQNGFALSASGSAALSDAQVKFGTAALALNGSSAVYGQTYNAALNVNTPSTSFTVECWAYLTALSGDPYLVTANNSGNTARWAMQVYGGRLAFYSGGSGSPPVGSAAIPTNQWVHLAVCYDTSTGVLKTFVGGVQDFSGSGVLNTATANMRLELGAAYFNNSNFANGYIDDVRITKGVARYNATFTPPASAFPGAAGGGTGDPYASSVSLLLHCDGSNGSNAFVDSSGYAHNVQASGAVSISTAGAKFGSGCCVTTGAWADYLSVANNVEFDFGTGDFTIEGWLKLVSVGANGGAFIGRWGSAPSVMADWLIYLDTSNRLIIYLNGQPLATASAAVPTDGNYHHIAMVRSGNTVTMYLDGTSVCSTAFSAAIQYSSSKPIRTHVWDDTVGRLNGNIDEIRITKGVARYTTNFTPSATAFPDPPAAPVVQKVTKFIGVPLRLYKQIRALTPFGTKRLLRVHRVTDLYNGGVGTIRGKVTVDDNPDSRKVRLYDLRSGRLLRMTWSAADGSYEFTGIDPALTYFVVGHDYTKTYNAVIQDMVKPV